MKNVFLPGFSSGSVENDPVAPIIEVVDAVVSQHVAEIPEFLDDVGMVYGGWIGFRFGCVSVL